MCNDTDDGLVEIELDLDEDTIKMLEQHSKLLGITKEELIVKILEEELLNEITTETSKGETNSPTKVPIG